MVKEIGYYNGVFDTPDRLSVPIEDRGYLFGEGVYEALMAYNNIFWGLKEIISAMRLM